MRVTAYASPSMSKVQMLHLALWVKSLADDIFEIFLLYFLENRIWDFKEIDPIVDICTKC